MQKKKLCIQGPTLSIVVAVLIIDRAVPWKQLKDQDDRTLSAQQKNPQLICDCNPHVPAQLVSSASLHLGICQTELIHIMALFHTNTEIMESCWLLGLYIVHSSLQSSMYHFSFVPLLKILYTCNVKDWLHQRAEVQLSSPAGFVPHQEQTKQWTKPTAKKSAISCPRFKILTSVPALISLTLL